MELPENKTIIILLLLADILLAIVNDFIVLVVYNKDDQFPAAIASVTTLAFLGALLLPATYTVLFIIKACKDMFGGSSHIVRKIVIALLQAVAVAFYFYGDNIVHVRRRYIEEAGCGEQCVTNNRIAAVMSLGLALLMLQFLPTATRKVDYIIAYKEKKSPWHSTLELVTTILKIDILYTAITIMAQTGEYCGAADIIITASFMVLCVLVGLAAMVITAIYSIKKTAKERNAKWHILLALLALMFSFPMYMLADNEQPLGCAFGCDTTTNATQYLLNCDLPGSSGTRLGLMSVTFALVSVVAVTLIRKDIVQTEETGGESDEESGGEKDGGEKDGKRDGERRDEGTEMATFK